MSLEAGIELSIRVLCDAPPAGRLDGAYLFGQTPDNQESVFHTAQRLYRHSQANRLLIPDVGALSGYPGIDVWRQALDEDHAYAGTIEGVDIGRTDIMHTRIEAEALVRHAQAEGYASLYIVSAPFHQLRAFMTAVTVALEEAPSLRLYSAPGGPLPWKARVTHSQGTLTETRADLIGHEWERIVRYQKKGDLGSISDVLDYLDRRDADPPAADRG